MTAAAIASPTGWRREAGLTLGALGRRLRRHRHQPALRGEAVGDRGRRPFARALRRAGRSLDDLLVARDRGDGQIRRLHHARRQQWRGRRDGAGRAGASLLGPGPRPQDRHRAGLARRPRAVLRRRHADARDLGPLGGRGPGRRKRRPAAPDPAADPRHPDRAVPAAALRDGADRQDVRPRHGGLVCRDGGAGRRRHRAQSADPQMHQSLLRLCAVRARALDGVRRAWLRRPGGDRLRGALCRYGPFRARADQECLALFRLPCAPAELFRPGRGRALRSARDRQHLLRARAALGALPGRRARDDGHRDREPGGDLRRLLDHPPGGAARPGATHGNPPYLRDPTRPDLRAADQHHARHRRRADRADLQDLRRPGRGLWHRG